MPDLPLADPPAIVVTASRTPETSGETPASVSLIDATRIERFSVPLIADYLRLSPSVSVATSGPAGSLTQLRIRGAEATHTLLFIDGIRANDPAAANEPRFELVNADLASRIEIVRGPQSALWGSEAIGGVVAVEGPGRGLGGTQAMVEAGSFATLRGAARASVGSADRGLALGIAGQRSAGIDAFGGHGDKDGYRNRAARISGRYRINETLLFGASGFALGGRSQFDGYDPLNYLHADTLDESRNRLAAGRVFAELGKRDASYALLSASLLGSSNRNYLADDFLNRTTAGRKTLGLEAGTSFGRHRLVIALDGEGEAFHARDAAFGGFTDQDRSRRHGSVTAEWKADFRWLRADVAIRHDIFSRFKDASSLRGSLLAPLGGGFDLAATYGEGIAQPSFFDLYGFFPGSFAGNPGLKPERSRGGEVSLRYRSRSFDAALTAYRQRLGDEIIDLYDPGTYLSTTGNAAGHSRRQGVEIEAAWAPSAAVRLTAAYAWLDASEPTAPDGGQVKEQRRPKHSASLAADGAIGRLSYGTSIAYTGARVDTDFDQYPAARVRLSPYWLASARIAYRLTPRLEATARLANALDQSYQDAVGYRAEGRSVHVGLRLAFGD